MKKEVWGLVALLLVSTVAAQNRTLTVTDLQEIDDVVRSSEQRIRSFVIDQVSGLPAGGTPIGLESRIAELQDNLSTFGDSLRTQVLSDLDNRLRETEDAVQSIVQQESAGITSMASGVTDVAEEVSSGIGKIIALAGSMLAISILILVLVCILVFRKPRKPAAQTPLQRYVADARKAGASDAQIRQQLSRAGYPPSDINAALR